MEEEYDYPEILKQHILSLISQLRDCVCENEEEEGDLAIIEFLIEKQDATTTLNNFVEHVFPHRKYIAKRDKNFFKVNKAIFKGLPDKKVEHYGKKLTDEVHQENIDIIFDYFDEMLECCDLALV